MTYRCRTCQGTYDSIQDGVKYYHRCPPTSYSANGKVTRRANERNENIDLSADNKGRAKSEGAGVEDV